MNTRYKKFFSINVFIITLLCLNQVAEASKRSPKTPLRPVPNPAELTAFSSGVPGVRLELKSDYQGNKSVVAQIPVYDKTVFVNFFKDMNEQRFKNAWITFQASRRERESFFFSIEGRHLVCVDSVKHPSFKSSSVFNLPRGSRVLFLRESLEHQRFTTHDGFMIEVYLKHTNGTVEKRIYERPDLHYPTWKKVDNSTDIDPQFLEALNNLSNS